MKLAAERLHAYMAFRAAREGKGYSLSPEFFRQHLELGVRDFFGVRVTGDELMSESAKSGGDGGVAQAGGCVVRALLVSAALFMLDLAAPALADTTIVPDPTLTPGAIRTTDVGEICSTGTKQLRHWNRERDDWVLAEYGLPSGRYPDFEIDHLVPLGIGGADDIKNLWPEPRRSVEPTWNAEAKDRLEWRLRDLICSGTLDVRAAQRMIADDWIDAFQRIFPGSNLSPPLAEGPPLD